MTSAVNDLGENIDLSGSQLKRLKIFRCHIQNKIFLYKVGLGLLAGWRPSAIATPTGHTGIQFSKY